MTRGLLIPLFVTATTAFAAGTPFFPTRPQSNARWTFQDTKMAGRLSEAGLELSFSTGDRVRWNVQGAGEWRMEPQGNSVGVLRDLRGHVAASGEELPLYSELTASVGYSGLSLSFERIEPGLKSTVSLAHGMDAAFLYEGARSVDVAEDGRTLNVQLSHGTLRETALVCFEQTSSQKREVPCRFSGVRALGGDAFEYRVTAERRDANATLLIDPVFVYVVVRAAPRGI